MKQTLLIATFIACSISIFGQTPGYMDSIKAFRADYIKTHELLTTPEQKALLRFYPLDPSYRVVAHFEKYTSSPWFAMATSGAARQIQRKYGCLTFVIHDTTIRMMIYQSQALMQKAETRDYLFIPFTDATSGTDSYDAGRYIDCQVSDIQNATFVLDFNKAYNPYCAYTTGYNCPLPPPENNLPVAIRAGEQNYGKGH
jgi:uncharacterized protein